MNNKVKKRKHRSWKAWAVLVSPKIIVVRRFKKFVRCYGIPFPVIITEVRPLNNKVEGV